jgi:hypothetical protein
MKLIRQFYSTKVLYKNGIFISICLGIALVLSLFVIPDFNVGKGGGQLYQVRGEYVKYNDHEYVSQFFRSIQRQRGVLILGTSESSPYPDGNYFDYLNQDPDLKETRFSVLGGAGRTCGLHIPTFLRHRTELKGLKVVYFINPIYWRNGLSEMGPSYWERDHDYQELADIELTAKERERYFMPVQVFMDSYSTQQRQNSYLNKVMRDLRKPYYQDARYLIEPNLYTDGLKWVPKNTGNLKQFKNFGTYDPSEIDTSWNVTKEFMQHKVFRSIDVKSNYRKMELESFIHLCQDLEIDVTFIVGPYNKKFIEKHESSAEIENVVVSIKTLLNENNASYIDASDLSNEVGAFNDFQHHSNYGAYLIYKKIKQHYLER